MRYRVSHFSRESNAKFGHPRPAKTLSLIEYPPASWCSHESTTGLRRHPRRNQSARRRLRAPLLSVPLSPSPLILAQDDHAAGERRGVTDDVDDDRRHLGEVVIRPASGFGIDGVVMWKPARGRCTNRPFDLFGQG